MMRINVLGSQIGAEILGVDVKNLDDETFGVIYQTWLGISKHPYRRLLSRDKTPPITTFDNFFRCARSGRLHPRLVAADASVFSFVWCRPFWHRTIHPSGSRHLDVSPLRPNACPWHASCPRKPSVPCRVQACINHK